MSTPTKDPKAPIPLWRARAWPRGGHWTDAASGFGGPDVAEAVGTAAQVGAVLTGFLAPTPPPTTTTAAAAEALTRPPFPRQRKARSGGTSLLLRGVVPLLTVSRRAVSPRLLLHL
jgi:hypothetical protein